ncbi:HAD-IB family hydrolase [Streptomyces fulvorobeus]|nr:HAD-IB family hydrolase [Streptomyces fulvorobeus]
MSEHIPRFTYPTKRTDPLVPPDVYAQAQREEPVCPITLATGDPAWFVARHEDVRTALSDRRFSREALFRPGAARAQVVEPDPDSMLTMDPPRHTRLRKLANRAFSPQRVERLRPYVEQVAADLLDAMEAGPPAGDLAEVYARPLALRVICRTLGVPFEDYDRFGAWSDRFMSLTKYPPEEINQASQDMREYFAQLIGLRRAEPGDDLISALVQIHDEEGEPSEAEIVGLGTLVLIAGHDTTVTVLCGGTATLLGNPDQLALLRANPALFPDAVEEVVRLNGPGGGTAIRITTSDVNLGGTVIPEGSAVLASVGTASRDPEVYPEPDRYLIQRENRTQVAFGHGPHFCIGAGLARVELAIGMRALFDRFPLLRLAVPPEQLRWKDFAALGDGKSFPSPGADRAMSAHPAGLRPAHPPAVAFFDVDETLISVNSMSGFLRHHVRASGRPLSVFDEAVRGLRALAQGGAPRADVARAYYRLYEGSDDRELAAQGRAWFAAELRSGALFLTESVAALREHRRRGDTVVLVSGSFAPCLDPIAEQVGADAVFCARPETVGGVHTGRLGAAMIGEEKAHAVRTLLRERGIPRGRCHAYGDHATDLEMLRAVGHPVVVGADPVLVRHAEAGEWRRLPGAPPR